MVTVELHNLILYGYHGLHAEEKKVMNTFEVSLSVKYEEKQSAFEHIGDTISYADLYKIVKKKLETPVLLLEKLCQGIIRKIKDQYPSVTEISISIYKLQAPIESFEGKVGVSMRTKFDH